MGRHETDPIPTVTRVWDSGPMKRIRHVPSTTEPIPSAETKRRAWPLALVIGGSLAAAVALPVGLFSLSAEENPEPSRPAVTVEHSPEPSPSAARRVTEPVPTVTVTKNRIEYKTKRPAPAPTATIYVTSAPKLIPAPKITVRVTIRPKAAPTVTETATDTITNDRCFQVRNEVITGEIECP